MNKLRIIELFGGIGAFTKALKNLNIPVEIVDYVEIDKYAVKSFNAIHGTNFEPQDIKKWNKNINVDIIMHGSPCQDFSIAGKQAGGNKDSETRSSLMYETIRIVENLKPKVVIWENVKNLLSKKHRHNFDSYLETMEQIGYKNYYQVLNSKDYGIPQNRERVFTISIRKDIDKEFEFPKKQELKLKLKDMLEDNVDEKYYLSDKMINYISEVGTKTFHNKDSRINLEIARPLTTEHGKRAGTTNYLSDDFPANYDLSNLLKSKCKRLRKLVEKTNFESGKVLNMDLYNQVINEDISQTLTLPNHNSQRIFDGVRIRRLTPLECFKLMGFSKEDFMKAKSTDNSDTQLYKQAGNSIVVKVLEEIIKELLKVIKE